MTREEMEELNGLAASMGLYEDRNPCKRATILGKAIKELEQEPTTKNDLVVDWESYKDVDGNSLDDLILEVLQNNFDCGNTYGYKVADEIIGLLPSVTPQEPKPMIEIDLYSVIKQKYIEREVLDEIRAEIEEQVLESLSDGGDDWFTAEKVNECLEIIDKYKVESEGKE